ncbi:HAMP domain-containing histidine kinase [Bacillus sp. FJAT-49711]|uniref:sensor histidine kinase n=1 Tax=Bacillus sp. FJAT-49711 TaxID=2833585 RepID=UPI001BC9AFCA|nr:HAMP domain-containing sensor histidine kinase [Bacillus sp. FJAT-49711]MBS4219948.1 HAMP domain-containing histidine kinase [Bacillus sp. FJAT-49711]
MSIRKRLIISNATMIVMPIIIIVFIIFLLNVVYNDGTIIDTHFKQRWQNTGGRTAELFNELQKTASIEQDNFFKQDYLESLSEQLEKENVEIVIRKENDLLITSNPQIKNDELPSFGNEGYNPGGAQVGNDHFSIRQHDFYFKDGSEGSIFLLDDSPSFVKFARIFFPIIFGSLILSFVLTNVFLSYIVSRSILRPVRQLSDASEKISRGDLNFSVKSKSKDELGQLIRTFDSMRGQLKESLDLRDRYEKNRKEIIANISHDLKTPITSILGYVEGLQDGVANSDDKREQYLDTIRSKAIYMNRLIEELALYSKLDVNSLPFHFESVDIQAFIKDYLEEISEELIEKDVKVLFHPNMFHSHARIDRDKLIRVLENIIFNSVKYIDKNPAEINISISEEKNMIKISVSDNGPGVPPEELAAIFNRFYRTDPARSEGGSGLGLAIVSQIIEAHGGNIWAENVQTEGLRVNFTLKKSEDENNE